MKLAAILLHLIRGGLFLVPFVPLLVGGRGGFWLPVIPELYFPDVTLKAFVFRGLIVILMGLWAVLACIAPRYRLRPTGPLLVLSAFVGVIAVVDVLGHAPAQSFWSNLERMEGLVGLLHLLAYFVIASTVFDSPRWWRRIALTSLGVCLVVCAFGLAQGLAVWSGGALEAPTRDPDFLTWFGRLHVWVSEARYFRADARFGSPVFLAVYLLLHAWIAALLLSGSKRWAQRLWLSLAIVSILVVLFLTKTRTAVVALAVGMALAIALLAVSPKRSRRARLVAIVALGSVLGLSVVVGTLVVLVPEFTDSIGLQRMRLLGPSLVRRSLLWEIGLQGFLEHPVLGWGQENFVYPFDKYCEPGLWIEKPWFDHPHSVFLGWFVAGGVFGGVAYLALFATPFFCIWSRKAAFLSRAQQSLLTGMLASYGLFNLSMLDSLTSYLVFLSVLAYLDAMRRNALPAPQRQAASRTVVAVVAVVAPVLAALVGWKVNVPAWRSAAAIARATEVHGVSVVDGKPRFAIEEALAIDSFARPEARVVALQLAAKLHGDSNVPPEFMAKVSDVALRGMEAERRERPVSVRTLFLNAHLLNRTGDHRSAIELLDEAMAISPRKRMVIHELANAHLLLGNMEEAFDLARRPHEWEPEDPEARVVFAVVALHAGPHRVRVAEEVLAKAYPPGEFRLPDTRVVEALLALRRFDLLEGLYAQLVEMTETQLASGKASARVVASLWLALGQSRADSGHKIHAIETLRRMPKIHPPSTKRASQMIVEWSK